MGWLTQFQGDTQQAEAAYREMLGLSQELGDKGNIATALNSLGMLAVAQGDNQRARALLEENLAVLKDLEDEGDTTTAMKRFHALNLLGILAVNEEGDCARGAALWEESLALAREEGNTFLVGTMLSNLGYVALLRGDNDWAATLCEEALAVAHELGSSGVEIVPEALVNLGLAASGRGDNERAAASFKEALSASQETGRMPTVINTLEGMASLAEAQGEAVRAARLWGAAEAAREDTGMALPPIERTLHEPYLAAARSRLRERQWEDALAEGRAMSLEEAVEYALSKEETDSPTTLVAEKSSADQPFARLTPREKGVALLVAKKMTNRQIASELTLSEQTVATHVRNILKKLRLYSRNQIAGCITEHQQLP
jgi:ATP/maltotriose-dependent transcriptional regulator MalT